MLSLVSLTIIVAAGGDMPLVGHPTFDASTAKVAAVAEANRTALRTTQYSIDARALLGPRDRPMAGQPVKMELFPGENLNIRGRRVEEDGFGSWTWVGAVQGDPGSEVNLTFNRGSVFGTVQTKGQHYEVVSDSNGLQWLHQIDPNSIAAAPDREVAPPTTIADQPSEGKRAQAKVTSGNRTVDLLIVYTDRVALQNNVYTLAANAVASMHSAFGNSGVTGTIRIVGYQRSTFDESTAPGGISGSYLDSVLLPRMAYATPPFAGLPTMRDDLNADLVLLIYDADYANGTCGAGYLLNTTPANQSFFGYSALGDSCISPFNNFAHELGHNLGGSHDYGSGSPYLPYAYGYSRTSSPVFKTIMGSNPCTMSSCTRINYYSNPSVLYSGVATGVTNQSDMELTLNGQSGTDSTIEIAADYQIPTGSAPGQPGSVSMYKLGCNGSYEMTWGSSTGNVGWYDVQSSASSSYTSPTTLYAGSNTFFNFQVSSTRYVRVRACNGVGCSAWSNAPIAATYFTGCF